MKSFAIVLVCYKRLNGIKRLISSLEKCDFFGRKDITLIFSIDHSENAEIELFANDYQWEFGPKIVRSFSEKQGLKKHILSCGNYTEQYDIIAVFEDDIYVSNSFFSYAYSAAVFYDEDDRIGGISLYAYQKNWLNWVYRFEPQKDEYDAYFMRIAQSWGQVWTKKQWYNFKRWLENNLTFIGNDNIPKNLNEWPETSWLKHYCLYLIKTNRYFVYPYYSLSTNFSDVGEHNTFKCNDYQVELVENKKKWVFDFLDEQNSIIYDEYMNRCFLGRYLGIDDNELTNDINGTINKKYYKRFVLSMEPLNYMIIDSFELSLRPIELSIINSIHGDDLFLYDTFAIRKNKRKSNWKKKKFAYYFRSGDLKKKYKCPALQFIKRYLRLMKIKK